MTAIIPQYLLGTYLLNSGGATRKVLLPDAFAVHDLALVESCKTLFDIPGIRCPASAMKEAKAQQ